MTHGSPSAWNERDHPRNPEDGKFVDRVGSGGWAQRISDSIGQGRGGPESTEDNPQLTWETRVRDLIREAGHDPDEVEADVEGFGQDYAEYADDPEGFVRAILEDMAD